MNTTLIIMAAGIGSRFGGGIKQLAKMGPNGEIIMDYSIRDAKEAGFNKVVFIIRKDIFEEFEEVIGNRIKEQIDVEYVFQELDDLPEGFEVPAGRTKPWGTGQAVLCCKDVVKEPFVIINADDYYGKEAFVKLHDFLVSGEDLGREFTMGMAGFILKNTLSDNGAVTRGICVVDDNEHLIGVNETGGIVKTANGAACDDKDGNQVACDPKSHVSMNMWGFTPDYFAFSEKSFAKFLTERGMEPKSEYYIPTVVDELISNNQATCEVIDTPAKWFGVTYAEDRPQVVLQISKLIREGVYPQQLWK